MKETSLGGILIGTFALVGMIFSFIRPLKIETEVSKSKKLLLRFKRVIIFYLYLLLIAAIFGLLRGFLGL